MRLEEQAALFAVQAAPLELRAEAAVDQHSWARSDLPGGLPGRVTVAAVTELVRRDLAQYGVLGEVPLTKATECGTEAARSLVRALGEEQRGLLRVMGAGREVVLHESAELAVSSWAHPETVAGDGRREGLGLDSSGHPVRRLAALGLVVVAGGRALLTGAGRWAAEQLGKVDDV